MTKKEQIDKNVTTIATPKDAYNYPSEQTYDVTFEVTDERERYALLSEFGILKVTWYGGHVQSIEIVSHYDNEEKARRAANVLQADYDELTNKTVIDGAAHFKSILNAQFKTIRRDIVTLLEKRAIQK